MISPMISLGSFLSIPNKMSQRSKWKSVYLSVKIGFNLRALFLEEIIPVKLPSGEDILISLRKYITKFFKLENNHSATTRKIQKQVPIG